MHTRTRDRRGGWTVFQTDRHVLYRALASLQNFDLACKVIEPASWPDTGKPNQYGFLWSCTLILVRGVTQSSALAHLRTEVALSP